ncbi:HlyD family efflux transporter periplasmic adaptor subunit [Sandarakinorhabdus sp.]|jgi:multidrug resistance efflux pump|uniref:HlyD family efflux transporter periplasmic adaptor subunit n=1 Tax=Sandarakinorhabdus sp. TaxID=1916663 RepID=UPI0033411213
MAGRIETLIRSNRLRLALATGMAALGLWAFAPYVTSEVGGEAYVNAPIIRMASPIPGIVAADLPPPGTAIAATRTARLVTARILDTGPLAALKGQQAALISARDLARRQIAEIETADARLASRSARFGRAASARLAATTAAAREALAGCQAEAAEAALQRERVEVLAQQRFATFTQRDRVRAVASAAQFRCAALGDQADALAIETKAAGHGLYLAGAAMDAPYGDQQRDRLLLRRQELENVVADADSRLAQLAIQVAAETERLARASAFDAQLPAGTVVWSQPAPKGTTVAPGASLIELADCNRRYVEVALPERRMEAIMPGTRVAVRLIGSDAWLNGQVASTVGAAARRDGAMLAANPDKAARDLSVLVSLPPPASLARRCDVGRLAEVRFPRW